MEDKQKICDELCKVLQLTRRCDDLVSLGYLRVGDDETVIIKFEGNYEKYIDVTCDSGMAMINDIVKNM